MQRTQANQYFLEGETLRKTDLHSIKIYLIVTDLRYFQRGGKQDVGTLIEEKTGVGERTF